MTALLDFVPISILTYNVCHEAMEIHTDKKFSAWRYGLHCKTLGDTFCRSNVIRVIRSRKRDIICLQESNAVLNEILGRKTGLRWLSNGYVSMFYPETSRIMHKKKGFVTDLNGMEHKGRQFVAAVVKIGRKNLAILNVHGPHEPYDVVQVFENAFQKCREKVDCVHVMGDFNYSITDPLTVTCTGRKFVLFPCNRSTTGWNSGCLDLPPEDAYTFVSDNILSSERPRLTETFHNAEYLMSRVREGNQNLVISTSDHSPVAALF